MVVKYMFSSMAIFLMIDYTVKMLNYNNLQVERDRLATNNKLFTQLQ